MSNTPRIDRLESFRNLIINGNFDFWQRGTSFTSIANNAYSADRFIYSKSGTTATQDLARSSDVPTAAQSGFQSSYSTLITQSATTDTTVGASDRISFQHRVEGHDYSQIHSRPFRLQFWVKASIAGNYSVSFHNESFDRSYVTYYT